MAGVRPGRYRAVLCPSPARSGHDQVRPQKNHCARDRLAFFQRAQAGAEGVSSVRPAEIKRIGGVTQTTQGRCRLSILAAIILTLVALASPTLAHDAAYHGKEQRLPKIGPAPGFTLTSQDGAPITLADFRGKVVAVTFIYASCSDTCPVLTALMAYVQDQPGQ